MSQRSHPSNPLSPDNYYVTDIGSSEESTGNEMDGQVVQQVAEESEANEDESKDVVWKKQG